MGLTEPRVETQLCSSLCTTKAQSQTSGEASENEKEMVPRGLEPGTLRLLALRSNQLSYETLATANILISMRPFPQQQQP